MQAGPGEIEELIRERLFAFPGQHFLSITDLNRPQAEALMGLGDAFVALNRQRSKAMPLLAGRTLVNLFFENSTRTQASFELAAKRLGADVVNMSPQTSSIAKGETLIDTAVTLNAMQPDLLVIRHGSSGAASLLAQKVDGSVINAGDGQHEHPTQAVLDALSMKRALGRIEGLTVAICGDVLHSRVARSNVALLQLLGARVRLVAPKTLMPSEADRWGCDTFNDLKAGIEDCDVVMMLRLQLERMQGGFVPSTREYFRFFGLDREKLAHAKPGAKVMHPGPMNRGVEIDSDVADDPAISLIQTQVEMGVAARMAVLAALSHRLGERAMTQPTVITNVRLIDPATRYDGPGSVIVRGGLIAEVSKSDPGALSDDLKVIDGGGKALIPGLVDLRVKTGEPGSETKETLKSASRAAAAGGVTSIVVMPDTDPAVDDPAMVDFILRRTRDIELVHVYPAGAATKGLGGQQMAEIGLMHDAGAVFITDGDKPIVDSKVLRRILTYASGFDMMVAHRPVDPWLARGAAATGSEFAGRYGIPSVPLIAERIGLERDLALAEITKARLLVDQITCADALESLRRGKDKGVAAVASCSINHLSFNELDIGDYRTFAKLDPPLRAEADRQALIDALASGLVDIVVSAHAPAPAEDKRLPFDLAAPGSVGLETLLPGLLSLYHEGRVPLLDLIAAVTVKPADILGLKAGRIAKGAPADLVLVDLDAPRLIDADKLLSKSKNSAFDGRRLQGKVLKTIVDGRIVFG